MAPAPKLAVPQIENQSTEKLQSLPALDEKLRLQQPYSVDEYRLHILKQEMEFNPELREKVEAIMYAMKERQQAEAAKKPKKEGQKNFDGWIFDNLRLMYESQGKELPDLMKLAEQGDQANQDTDQLVVDPLAEWRKAGTKMAKITGLTEEGMDGQDRFGRTNMSMLGTSLAERLKVNRERMAEAKENTNPNALTQDPLIQDPLASAFPAPAENFNPFVLPGSGEQSPEGQSAVMTWQGEQFQPSAEEAEILAEIEGDSAKDTFQPGELQWFENADDTLPVASPEQRMVMNQGLIKGEMDIYLDKIKDLNAELMQKESEIMGDLSDYQLSEANFNRPNIDIPMEQFIQEASRDPQQIRKAEQIQNSIQRSKEQRTKMLRPSMDIQSTQQIMTPHDLLGPNVFRPWERERRGNKERRDPRDDPRGQNLN